MLFRSCGLETVPSGADGAPRDAEAGLRETGQRPLHALDVGQDSRFVETDTAGVTTSKIDEKLSLRASITGEIHLDDARVDESAVLPDVGGMKGPLSCLTQARFGIAWGAVGAARNCFETARQYATDREQFGGRSRSSPGQRRLRPTRYRSGPA